MREITNWLRSILRRPSKFARGGEIKARPQSDDMPFLLSEGRAWRQLPNGDWIETDDRLLREINKTRQRP